MIYFYIAWFKGTEWCHTRQLQSLNLIFHSFKFIFKKFLTVWFVDEMINGHVENWFRQFFLNKCIQEITWCYCYSSRQLIQKYSRSYRIGVLVEIDFLNTYALMQQRNQTILLTRCLLAGASRRMTLGGTLSSK